jgi:hypothetical protein
MTATELLADLTRRGFTLTAEEGSVRVRPASRMTPQLRRLIRCHKAELVSLLRGPQSRGSLRDDVHSPTPPSVRLGSADLPGDCLETWEERAAIAEFDGCLTREQAEAQALQDLARPDVHWGQSAV